MIGSTWVVILLCILAALSVGLTVRDIVRDVRERS